MNLLILTASNRHCKRCRRICASAIALYCTSFPEIQYLSAELPDNEHTTWSKLRLIEEKLVSCDYLLWIDPDALIIGRNDFRELIQPHTLNIAVDCNGINGGVMAWRNCPDSFDVLKRVHSLRPEFENRVWQSQSALASFIDEVDVFYQPKEIWNAYAPEVNGVHDECADTMVLHWPGLQPDAPYQYMDARFKNFLKS